MIKATDVIEKIERYVTFRSTSDKLEQACFTAAHTLIEPKIDQKLYFSSKLDDRKIVAKHRNRIEQLAKRFEREFLREKKKSKYIILYGSDDLTIVDIYMLPMDIGITEKPEDIIYENAVFESREEAEYIAINQMLECYIIVEVPDDN